MSRKVTKKQRKSTKLKVKNLCDLASQREIYFLSLAKSQRRKGKKKYLCDLTSQQEIYFLSLAKSQRRKGKKKNLCDLASQRENILFKSRKVAETHREDKKSLILIVLARKCTFLSLAKSQRCKGKELTRKLKIFASQLENKIINYNPYLLLIFGHYQENTFQR